jgi:spore maturation protein CgeB
MNIALFYHSLVSDWNHGNAHFLRGVVSELLARGHEVRVFEPADGWSRRNLLDEQGADAIDAFREAYPRLKSTQYDPSTIDVDRALDGADLVIVHEWNTPELIHRVGAYRRGNRRVRLLFHDTHHRSVSAAGAIAACDLREYDGVLAFGSVIRDRYLDQGWAARAWTWHEAADVRVFRPLAGIEPERDLVWIGNWGDEERTRELEELLLEPARTLRLSTSIYGVRYPAAARARIAAAGFLYGGWVANFHVPQVFARHRVTVHVPRRPYVTRLPGIPTIRPFEALACGIPLVSAPWDDIEGLFRPGQDYLVARTGTEMTRALRAVLRDRALANSLSRSGRERVLRRHTCAHRVDELMAIHGELVGNGQRAMSNEWETARPIAHCP